MKLNDTVWWVYLVWDKRRVYRTIDLFLILCCGSIVKNNTFVIDKQYVNSLLNKIVIFKKITINNKQIFLAMIAVNGLKKSTYSEKLITNFITFDDLFI